MMKERVCIVGLGLMGGSLALALRLAQRSHGRYFPLHLTIVDRNPQTRVAAQHVADLITDDFATGVKTADLVILATPVRSIIRLLGELPDIRPDGCMVLDLGSSKAQICHAMSALPPNFEAIGGHPMCGREVAGFGAAFPDLYRNKMFILCETGRTTDAVTAQAEAILSYIGSTSLHLQPQIHDEMVAVISHLPYLVSAALIKSAAAMADERLWHISASSFRDSSRVAGTNPRMMLDILLTNKTAVLQQIAEYKGRLTAVAELIKTEDEVGLMHWLTTAQEDYDLYQQHKQQTPL